MRRSRSLLLGLVVPMLLALAPVARAQSSSVVLFGVPGGKILSDKSVQITAEGQIVVSFHGDAGTGCATYGLCAYSGTIVERPRTGAFAVLVYRQGGKLRQQLSLALEPGPGQYYTAASVERSIPGQPPGRCADLQSNALDDLSSTPHHGAVTIRLFNPGGTSLSTRCAGPLDADVAGAVPAVTIPLERLIRGRMTVSLSGTGTFAAHGFAGTVDSTLALVLGKPSKTYSQPQFPSGTKTTRIRALSERLTLIRLAGNLGATIQGAANPLVCRLLDSCGLVGTFGFGAGVSDFTGDVVATGPATRPYRDFLAALGLSAGNPRGISVEVGGSWTMGPVMSDLNQFGTCTDSGPGGPMVLDLAGSHREFKGFVDATSWRTRCPGPTLDDPANPQLAAVLPRSALGRRTFTIELRSAGAGEDDGYTVALHGHLSLVVRRGRISQSVITAPAG